MVLGKCCSDMEEAIEKGIFFNKNNEINLGTNIKPMSAFNLETNEEYDPNDFLMAYCLRYCPFCGIDLRGITDEAIKKSLLKRNIRRIKNLQKIKKAYCPIQWKFIIPGSCMFCQYGHMLECHYPYDCNSKYCKHYQNHEEY